MYTQAVYFDQVWDATGGLKPRRNLPKTDISRLSEGDIVQLECQVQRYVPGEKAPMEWEHWRVGLRLLTATRLVAATPQFTREIPSDVEDNVDEEDDSLYDDADD